MLSSPRSSPLAGSQPRQRATSPGSVGVDSFERDRQQAGELARQQLLGFNQSFGRGGMMSTSGLIGGLTQPEHIFERDVEMNGFVPQQFCPGGMVGTGGATVSPIQPEQVFERGVEPARYTPQRFYQGGVLNTGSNIASLIQPEREFRRALSETNIFERDVEGFGYVPQQFRQGGMYSSVYNTQDALRQQRSGTPSTLMRSYTDSIAQQFSSSLAYPPALSNSPTASSAQEAFHQLRNIKRHRNATANQYTGAMGPPQKKGVVAQTMPSAMPGFDRQHYANLNASIPPQYQFTQIPTQKQMSNYGRLPPLGLFAPPRPSSAASNRSVSASGPSTQALSLAKSGSKNRRPSDGGERINSALMNRRDSGVAVNHPLASTGIHSHRNVNQDEKNQQKRVDFIDLTSTDHDQSPVTELEPLKINQRLLLPPPPKSTPLEYSPVKKKGRMTKVSADAQRKKEPDEKEVQVRTDEQLAKQLQEEEQVGSKTRRLRSKTSSPEKRVEHQRRLRSASPEKRTQRTLRSNSPEKRPTKKLSVYEEFERIQQEAAQGEQRQNRKRILRSASPDKSIKRTRRDTTPEERRTSKQTTRVTMSNNNSTTTEQQLKALHEEFQVQARASASAEDHRKMPPPPPPSKGAVGHPMVPSENTNPSGDITKKGPTHSTLPTPLNSPKQRPPLQGMLHKPHNAKVTKQSYHTAHKQPYSMQEAQKPAFTHTPELHAQQQKVNKQFEYMFQNTRHTHALSHGVNMVDVEKTSLAYDICHYYVTTENRYRHLPNFNPDAVLPSVEGAVDLTGVEDEPDTPVVDLIDDHPTANDTDAAIPSSIIDNTATTSPCTNKSLSHLFTLTVPTNLVLNDPVPYNPVTPTEGSFDRDPADLGTTKNTFLEPYIDDDGCLRAPDPQEWTEEGALVEELLLCAEEGEISEQRDWATGWY